MVESLEGRMLLSAGQLDSSFGQDGVVAASLGIFSAEAMAMQADGKIVVTGSFRQPGSTYQTDFGVARYNSDGSLDGTFGTGGIAVTDVGGQEEKAHAIAIQADGRIVVAGETSLVLDQSPADMAIVRYNADGTLDESFAEAGKRIVDFNGLGDVAYSVGVTAAGKIVAAGSAGTVLARTDFAMVQLDANGSLDASFGAGGKVTTDFDANYDAAAAMAISADGSILLAGSSGRAWRFYRGITLKSRFSGSMALARYLADGSLDSTFDGGGKATITWPFGAAATAVALTDSGKIVVGGQHWRETGGSELAVVRLNANGSLDSEFGSGGCTWTAVEDNGRVNALTLQADGRVIAAGVTAPSTLDSEHAVLIRQNADGTLDQSFGAGGIVRWQANTSIGGITAVARQMDGKIVATGLSGSAQTVLMRMEAGLIRPFATLARGILSVNGTRGNDVIRVERTGTQIAASLNTMGSIIFNASEVRRINIASGNGADTITVRAGTLPSVIRAGAGNDKVFAGAGNDSVYGGGGDDVIYGGNGNDRLVGEGGRDTLVGGDGQDTLVGDDRQRDVLRGGRGRDSARKDRFDVASGVEELLA